MGGWFVATPPFYEGEETKTSVRWWYKCLDGIKAKQRKDVHQIETQLAAFGGKCLLCAVGIFRGPRRGIQSNP